MCPEIASRDDAVSFYMPPLRSVWIPRKKNRKSWREKDIQMDQWVKMPRHVADVSGNDELKCLRNSFLAFSSRLKIKTKGRETATDYADAPTDFPQKRKYHPVSSIRNSKIMELLLRRLNWMVAGLKSELEYVV